MNRPFFFALLISLCSAHRARTEEYPSLDDSQKIVIQATKIQLDPDNKSLRASGSIRLDVGRLEITASLLTLNLASKVARIHNPTVLGYENLILKGKRLVLHQQETTLSIHEPEIHLLNLDHPSILIASKIATCKNGTCTLFEANGSACPHEPKGYRIRADKVTIHPSGDIDLRRPVLVVGGLPCATLPWIRLRPSGSAGFGPPRLGWSQEGGMIFGPSGYVPLGSKVYAEGHLAVRTAQGLESRTRLISPHLDLTLDHLADIPDNHIRLRGRIATELNRAFLTVDLDIVTDRQIIDDLARDPLERASTHTVSRGLVSTEAAGIILETYAGLLQPFNRSEQAFQGEVTPMASIGLTLPSTPVARFFWPGLDAKFTRYSLVEKPTLVDSLSRPVPGHSRLEIAPRLDVPSRMGPLSAEIRIGSRHQVWLLDISHQTQPATHLASLETILSVPLARSFNHFTHTIKPLVRYRITPWLRGTTPFFAVDDFDRLRRGQGLEAGLITDLSSNRSGPAFQIEVIERFDLPGFGAKPGPAYLAANGIAGPRWLELSADGSWDHTQNKPSMLGLTLASRHAEQNSIALGGRWIGPGRGSHHDQPMSGASGPWLARAWPTRQTGQMEVFEDLTISLTRQITATTGARLGVWPDSALHALWYGLSFHPHCSCLIARITASHRLFSPVPDMMATLELTNY